MHKTISFDEIIISCTDDLIKEYEIKGYKFVKKLENIDYKNLLKRYIAHVVECEGIDFIDSWHHSDVELQENEKEILRKLTNNDLERI